MTDGEGTAVRVLLVEDDPADVELLEGELRRGGLRYTLERLEDPAGIAAVLETSPPEIVICDHRLPGYSGMEVLRLVRQRAPAVPFILITGSLDDEAAVAYMREGAWDYLVKDRLARLCPAIEAALARAAEQRRADQQQRLMQAIFDADPTLISVKSRDGRFRVVNRAEAERFGMMPDQLIGRTEAELNPNRAEVERVEQHDRDVIDSGRPGPVLVEAYTAPLTGETQWFRSLRLPLELPWMKEHLVLEVASDVTADRLGDERLHHLMESLPDATLVVDEQGSIVFASLQAESTFGYTREELVGQSIDILLPERLREGHRAQKASYVSDPKMRLMGEGLGLLGRRKNGTEFPVEVSLSPARTRRGLLVTCSVRDISPRRTLEAQLRQAQKMEAVGRLTGGIAHDFNNILMAIVGYTDFVLAATKSSPELAEDVREIQKAADRATVLTRQLLAFSRRQVLVPQLLDLNALVTDMGRMLHRLIGEDMGLRVHLADDLGTVRADPGQIEQVVMNLVLNARDAMPTGGNLDIGTANVALDQTYVESHPYVTAGPYVALWVSDSGIGMSKEILGQIFEPFFTTKEVGKGTGLGLATVYGIVKQSGGHISVYSEPDRGSTFKIYLPRVNGEATQSIAAPVIRPPVGGQETILVVDDDDSVRALVRRTLIQHGYTALVASNPAMALQVAREHAGPINLLVTDMVMPGRGGRELADELTGVLPGLKVLYMSGYPHEAIVRHGVLEPGIRFLGKPISAEVLLRTVRDLLDGPADAQS